MPKLSNGLIITPALMQHQVSIDLNFEPSVGILARKVDKLGASIRSFKEPLKRAVKDVMIPSIRRNFDEGGRPAWEPLAPATIENRGGDTAPLVRTGLLRRTMGYINIWHIDGEKAMITDLPDSIWYGKVHQAGMGATREVVRIKNPLTGKYTESVSGNIAGIPARPFVVMQDEDVDDIEEIFDDWIDERVRAAGLG